MPRPFKCRRVAYLPHSRFFKPAGIPVSELETLELSLDEAEAIRLADFEGWYQEDAAKQMNISRPTFANIIESARKRLRNVFFSGKRCVLAAAKWKVVRAGLP